MLICILNKYPSQSVGVSPLYLAFFKSICQALILRLDPQISNLLFFPRSLNL